MTTPRDISLLPTVHKIFAKCLTKRTLPTVVDTAINFWQRAYIKNRDRQELIFCLKTAIDDFKHISSKFYTLFIDFRDAFGSLDQRYLIRTLLESGVLQNHCGHLSGVRHGSRLHHQVISRCNRDIKTSLLLIKRVFGHCNLPARLLLLVSRFLLECIL